MKINFLIGMLCVIGNVFSQSNGAITGTVSDIALDNEPILFATIQLKNTSKSTLTNFHGNYEFTAIVPGNYTLVFSFLGYETIEVPVQVTPDKITSANGALRTKTLALESISMPAIAISEKRKTNLPEKNTPLK